MFCPAGFTKEAAEINRTWAKSQLEQYIQTCFPNAPLNLVGFQLAQCDKAKVIKRIEFQTVLQLERKVGKGKLLVIPQRDLPRTQVGRPPGVKNGFHTLQYYFYWITCLFSCLSALWNTNRPKK